MPDLKRIDRPGGVVSVLWQRFREVFRQSLLHNILSLYSVHFAYYLLPLITVPYLARVLGAAGWGYVAFTQGSAGAVTILVEYGFNFSATREASLARHSRPERAQLLASILGAKALLAAIGVALVLLASPWIPIYREHPDLLAAGLAWAVAQGFSLSWYFAGLERMRAVATMEVSARVVAAAGIFLLVRHPGDSWKVLAIQAVAAGSAVTGGLIAAYREVEVRLPRWRAVFNGLRVGKSLFVFRGAESIYNAGSSFLLGLWAPPQAVAWYAGAERLSKAVYGVLEPISRGLYPRLNYLVRHQQRDAYRTIRVAIVVMTAGGVLLGLGLFVSAPLLIRIMLGPQFGPAVLALRILSLLPLLVAIKTVIGFQWMLPFRLDSAFNKIIVGAGIVHLTFVMLVGRHYSHLGMAWALVIAEGWVVLCSCGVVWARGLNPWKRWPEEADAAIEIEPSAEVAVESSL